MLIFGVRAKIWDFFDVRTQKWVRPKCHWIAIYALFEYINLVKFSKNPQNFLKRRLQCRFGRFAPENLKTLQSNPHSGRNPAIETPLRGSEIPLYLVHGRQKGLGRGLMHPCSEVNASKFYVRTSNPIQFQENLTLTLSSQGKSNYLPRWKSRITFQQGCSEPKNHTDPDLFWKNFTDPNPDPQRIRIISKNSYGTS